MSLQWGWLSHACAQEVWVTLHSMPLVVHSAGLTLHCTIRYLENCPVYLSFTFAAYRVLEEGHRFYMATKMAPGMAKMLWLSSGTQGQPRIIVSVFCLYKERLIFTLRMLPEVTGTSVAAAGHACTHTEVSHLPGPPTPGAIREFEKRCIFFFFVSFGISLMQDCLLYLESTFGKRKKQTL